MQYMTFIIEFSTVFEPSHAWRIPTAWFSLEVLLPLDTPIVFAPFSNSSIPTCVLPHNLMVPRLATISTGVPTGTPLHGGPTMSTVSKQSGLLRTQVGVQVTDTILNQHIEGNK